MGIIASALENYKLNNFAAIYKARNEKRKSMKRHPFKSIKSNQQQYEDFSSSDEYDFDRAPRQSKLIGKIDSIKRQINGINERDQLLGGKDCGWNSNDHQQFLKLRTKHKNNLYQISFRSDCMLCLPYFSEDVIMEHIERFLKREKLMKEKKTLT